MTSTFKTASVGSVSHATMRPEDLIPCFLSELRALGHPTYTLAQWEKEYDTFLGEDGDILDVAQGDASELLTELFDALEEHSPPYCSFGAHEGDGSDFGFWFSQESFDNACADGEVIKLADSPDFETTDLETWNGAEYAAVISDHGNITLYNRDGEIVLEIV